MRRLMRGSRGGFTLVEVLLAVFVLALTAMMLAVVFPTAQISRIKAAHMSYAVYIGQQALEQQRSAGYASILVTDPVVTPLPELPSGSQTISISQYAANIKKIDVDITWGGYRKVQGRVHLATLVTDHG